MIHDYGERVAETSVAETSVAETSVAERQGKTITRNVSWFKKVITEDSDDEYNKTRANEGNQEGEPREEQQTLRKSSRTRQMV